MSAIRRTLSTPTPQTERSNNRQVKNNAGGYVYPIDDKGRLERFLILGTSGGTYYVSERKLTNEAIDFVTELIGRDPRLVYDVTSHISKTGRAKSNDQAIYVIAAMMSHGSESSRPYARLLFDNVVRTSRHLYTFAHYIEMMSGWGSSKRKAVSSWYTSRDPDALAYQAVKYRGSSGRWTHRDMLRVAHPDLSGNYARVRDFMLGKVQLAELDGVGDIIDGFLLMQGAKDPKTVCNILSEYNNLPWETIPTQFLRDPEVWKTLFRCGQLDGQNAIRNVVRMYEIGCFNDLNFAAKFAANISDPKVIRKGRIHPMAYANAMAMAGIIPSPQSSYHYEYSHVNITGPVADGLEAGFYNSFGNLQKDMDSTLIALDVSGSMSSPVSGMNNISCAQGTALLSMVVARSTPSYMIRGFSGSFVDLRFSAKDSLAEACNKTISSNFGYTDCSLPMVWATENKVEVDKFVVMTDSETYAGRVKPERALLDYRQKTGIPAKLIVVGMTSNGFTIGDPADSLTLNVVGFDSETPRMIQEFGK